MEDDRKIEKMKRWECLANFWILQAKNSDMSNQNCGSRLVNRSAVHIGHFSCANLPNFPGAQI